MKGLVLATDGFEDSELSDPYYRLQESGWDVDVATPDADSVEGKHGYEFDSKTSRDYPGPNAAISAPTVASASAGFGSLSARCA